MLNKKLLELRKSNNLSQSALADKLHVSRQAISRWETGKTIPDIETLKEISILYNISLDELMESDTNNSTLSTKIESVDHTYVNSIFLIFATIATTVLPFISIFVALFTLGYLFIHKKNTFCKLFIFITAIFLLVGTRNTIIEINYWNNPGTTIIEQTK